jgi:hypothetical protein
MTLIPNLCSLCARFWGDRPGFTCDAFATGIPEAILEMRHDHRRPYPGDDGMLFQAAPGMEPFLPSEVYP